MEFCKKCGSILVPKKENKKQYYYCKNCNKSFKVEGGEKFLLEEKVKEHKKEVVVMSKSDIDKDLPKTKITCPSCGNEEAHWWTQQTRAPDEPPTLFYKCTKCGYTWRSYS